MLVTTVPVIRAPTPNDAVGAGDEEAVVGEGEEARYLAGPLRVAVDEKVNLRVGLPIPYATRKKVKEKFVWRVYLRRLRVSATMSRSRRGWKARRVARDPWARRATCRSNLTLSLLAVHSPRCLARMALSLTSSWPLGLYPWVAISSCRCLDRRSSRNDWWQAAMKLDGSGRDVLGELDGGMLVVGMGSLSSDGEAGLHWLGSDSATRWRKER